MHRVIASITARTCLSLASNAHIFSFVFVTMKMRTFGYFIFLLFVSQVALANEAKSGFASDTLKKIIIENANNQVIDNAVSPPIRYFNGDVRAYHEGSYFFCDSAKMIDNELFAFGNVVIIQHDTITMFADELYYHGDSLFAYLRSKVVLQNNNDALYTEYMEYDMKAKKAYYRDKAIMVSGNSTLKSKKGSFDVKNNLAIFEERVTVDGEDFHMVTDTLHYKTNEEIANWTTPALIKTDSSELYSLTGNYKTREKQAEFRGDAQYKKADVVATADLITYDGFLKKVSMYGKAVYDSKTDHAKADSIIHSENDNTTQLIGNASFVNEKNKASGSNILYSKKEDRFALKGRGEISDSTMFIIADILDYNEITKKGVATGDVIWTDTTSATTVKADSVYMDGTIDYMHASRKIGKSLLITVLENDTMFLASDTLKRFRSIIKRDSTTYDTIKMMAADNRVEIFKNDLQAVTDSLVFNEKDSVFTLFNRPILWTDTTQLEADTAQIFMKNKKISRLDLNSNALVITSPDMIFFNQIRGNTMTGNFADNALDELKVTGSSQCIYYMQDDEKAYIGVNQTDCSLMIFKFEAKKIKNIRFYTEPNSTISPIDAVDHEAIKLKGFNWKLEKRPLTMADILQ